MSSTAELAQRAAEAGVEILAQFAGGSVRRGWQGPDDEQCARRQGLQPRLDEVPQPASDAVADHGTSDSLAHDETHTSRTAVATRSMEMYDEA